MKEKLAAIFDAMHNIETKGQSTIIMADCIRELASVINSIPDKEEPQD